ncbi:MAG: bifunctional folylpolyglutamate synthase/dihydrofolate synthase [Acetatifactor sp.]|nr:bifunctional folylpolyglutamate synthase/dihydrofolate synthase [Acetatifactor sp.]
MEKREIATFEEAVDYLNDIPKFTSKHTLEETKAYLHTLGDPDRKLYTIHVAGTNGKGSVCAYLRSILEEAGKSVCVFTSPHLVDIRERFLIRGRMVDKEPFLEAFLQIYDSLNWEALERGEGYHPTFFEYLFFMAMLLFAEAVPDYCILETGLGGRLDATNAVGVKALCVITRIGLDHVEYLGHTVEQIAGEKAGILQEGVPLVYADVEVETSRVFLRKGEELGIKMYPVSKNDYTFSELKNKMIDFSLHTRYYGYIRLRLNTVAHYQMENASLAVRAAEVLMGDAIPVRHIVDGIFKCRWQGRMEEVFPEVYVDGAHNEDGIRAFLDTVRQDGVDGKRLLLFGAVSDKNYMRMTEQLVLSGLFAGIAVVPLKSGRTASLKQLESAFVRYPECNYTMYDSAEEGFLALREEQMSGERLYVVGSLYLVGEIKEFLNDQF